MIHIHTMFPTNDSLHKWNWPTRKWNWEMTTCPTNPKKYPNKTPQLIIITYSKGRCGRFSWSFSFIHLVIHPSIHPVIHPSRHGLFTLTSFAIRSPMQFSMPALSKTWTARSIFEIRRNFGVWNFFWSRWSILRAIIYESLRSWMIRSWKSNGHISTWPQVGKYEHFLLLNWDWLSHLKSDGPCIL